LRYLLTDQFPGPATASARNPPGDGQILLEVEQLIAIGKLPVEEQCGERAERGKRDRRKARCQSGGDQQAAAELEEDDGWEQRGRKSELLHVGYRRTIVVDQAPPLVHEYEGQEQPARKQAG